MKYEECPQYSHGQPQLGEVAAPGHGHQLGVAAGHLQLPRQLQGAATTPLHRRYEVQVSRLLCLYLQT